MLDFSQGSSGGGWEQGEAHELQLGVGGGSGSCLGVVAKRRGGRQAGGRVDDEDLLGDLVGVDRDVVAVDDVEVRVIKREREELEVLEEPGLDGARKGREARDVPVGRVGRGPVVEDALLEGERGARDAPLGCGLAWAGGGVGLALPRDEGLVGARDVEDVALELALLDGLVARVDAEPVPVADPVGRGLGLGVSGERWGKTGLGCWY
jgi:hypothetical protein